MPSASIDVRAPAWRLSRVLVAFVVGLAMAGAMAQQRERVRTPQTDKPAAASVFMKIKGVEGESSRTKHYEGDRQRIVAGTGGTRWECDDGGGGIKECTCKGILDCKALIDSGECKGGTVWEGEDPSEGGCDVGNP
jgi:hypothetical protein